MKKATLLGAFGAASLLLFTACDESLPGEKGFGTISPLVDFDPSVVASRSSRAASEIGDVTIHDLSLTLTSEDGSFSETYPYDNFPTDKGFPIGNYTLSASFGDPEAEGFELPSVGGSCDLTVLEGRASKPTLTAELNKAMVAIKFDQNLLDYMTSCSARLHSAGGTYVDYPTSETRAVYLKPGDVTVNLDFVKPNGKGGNLEVANFTAEPKHRYTMTVTLGGDGFGTAEGITITYDDALEQEDVTIDISDETLTTPAPELTYTGFTPGETVTIVEGSSTDAKPVFNIVARGKIAKAVLTTANCPSLTEAGWPAEVDLCSADASTLDAMKALGLKSMGLTGNTDVFGRLDLSGVLAHIAPRLASLPASTFTLAVTDAAGKSTDPVTFSVKVERLELNIAYDGVYAGESTIDLNVSYNGTDPANNITFEYNNQRGGWSPAEVVNVTESRANYVVTVKVPSDANEPLTFRASSGSATTEAVAIRTAAAPTVTVNNNDVFATTAWVQLSSADYDCASKTLEIYGSTNGTTFTKLNGTQSGAEFHITGLTPGTTYTLRGKVGSLESAPVTLTTEANVQLQNGNMDNGWSSTSKGSHNLESAPSPWADLNQISAGSSSNATNKYAHPNSTLVSSDSKSGKAAMIQSIAYGFGGHTAGLHNTNKCLSGELYLGTYSSGAQYGISFSSRPSSVKFSYKYSAYKSGETGYAEVQVLDAFGSVIASGTKNLNATSWTDVTIPLTYSRGTAKAASLKIKFRSSAESIDGSYVTAKTTLGTLQECYTGAKLYIDDVELAY